MLMEEHTEMNTTTKPTKPQLYLYHISQNVRRGYDTFDSAVVCAESEEEAQRTHPSHFVVPNDSWEDEGTWATCPAEVFVQCIGIAAPLLVKGIVCSSFNAG